ncbi:MAG: hypothetical protein LBB58_07110 [Cellulomonadaceae bacterium]|jgi:hypothetical protein|nr:hypothetical protein [Cellulomonadaceae bacterium]
MLNRMIRSSQVAIALSACAVLGSIQAPAVAAPVAANVVSVAEVATVADTAAKNDTAAKAENKAPKTATTSAKKANLTSKYAYKTHLANAGGQAAIDECTGGLTNMTAVTEYLSAVEGASKAYYPIHNECGGRPILSLKVGEKVLIENIGKFEVVATRNITRGEKATVLAGMPGSVLIQTCFDKGDEMRVVALAKAA